MKTKLHAIIMVCLLALTSCYDEIVGMAKSSNFIFEYDVTHR